nr:transcriptional regulator [Kribbella italica]
MAVLANAPTASFRFLKEFLEVSDSDLSKHMSALEAAGYVSATKDGRGRGATTTYKLTRTGQTAYNAHRDALRALLDGPL